MVTNHEENYRMTLPLGIVFALASLAATVIFVVYAVEWSESSDKLENPDYLRATFSYYAAVISLLTLIVFFNGYHLTKITI